MVHMQVIPPDAQGTGQFDGGTITEQKPIGFTGDGSVFLRIGPLFYWAWAHAKQEGYIGSHPHQAFEILTYVIQGEAHHGDSLGTASIVGAGGAQLIQAGSGVYHDERLVGPDCELFQIWFEPSIREALKRNPAYTQYEDHAFPTEEQAGVRIKTVLGEGSPVQLVASARMWDVQLSADSVYEHSLAQGYTLAGLALRGGGTCSGETQEISFEPKDFIVIQAEASSQLSIGTEQNEALRIVLIEVPTTVEYPLYPKAR